MHLRLPATFFLLFLTGLSFTATAESVIDQITGQVEQDLEQYVAAQAADFGRRVEFEVNRLDPRLNLPLCTEAPTTEFDRQSVQSRLSVRVLCNGEHPWSLYVPVRLQAWQQVVTAAGGLARGQRLSASDVLLSEVDVSSLRYGYFASPDEVVGMELKRGLDAGTPLYPNIVVAPQVIQRGDAVIISAQGLHMAVQAPGTALGDGRVGEQISVRNSSSQRVIRATVTATGQVEVRI